MREITQTEDDRLMPNIEEEPYCLKGVDLFRGLTTEEIASAERMTRVITRKKGEILYSPDEKKEVLFFLKEGKIQLYRLSAEGKKLVVATLGPNTFFGEMALVGQKMYDTFAEVLEDAILCIITRKDVARLLLAKPAIALNLVETLGRRLLEMESTLEDLAFKNVPTRLASTLLSMAEERNSNEILGVSHQDLAERLATLRETVTSTLDKFKAEGLVELGWRKIVILNKERLSHIAKG